MLGRDCPEVSTLLSPLPDMTIYSIINSSAIGSGSHHPQAAAVRGPFVCAETARPLEAGLEDAQGKTPRARRLGRGRTTTIQKVKENESVQLVGVNRLGPPSLTAR